MEEKKNQRVPGKKPSIKWFSSATQLRNGSFSLAVTAIVLAMIVLVNLIIGQLPSDMLNLDLSETGIFSISDTTREYLDTLEKDVTVEVVAERDSVDTRIQKFLEIYEDLSAHVSVSYVDPVLHPEVLTEHGISANSIVVSCEDTGKKQIISFGDIIVTEMDYTYYYTTETAFDAEGQLTSAVSAVASDNDKKLYLLRGHGEEAFSSSIGELLTKNSMITANLNLLEETEVPADCDLLVINNPSKDLGADEYTAVHNYLYQGGNVLMLRSVTDKSLERLDALMEDYGMTMVNSYIGDRERYYQRAGSAFYFFPEITSNETNVTTSSTILVGPAAGMLQADTVPENVTMTTLLTTSENAFREGNNNEAMQYLLAAQAVKTAPESAEAESEEGSTDIETSETEKVSAEAETSEAEKVSADIETSEAENASADAETSGAEEVSESAETASSGPAELLVDGALDAGSENWIEQPQAESKLVVLTVPSMISASITDSFSGIENLNEFVNILTSYFEDVQNVSIPAKSLQVTYNTVTNGGFWNILFIGVIPAMFLICGLTVWIRRRKA